MTQIVGYKRKKGEFTDETGKTVQYDNYILYYVSDEYDVVDRVGKTAGQTKAKPDKFTINGAKSLEETLNKDVILVPDLQNPKYIARIVVL